MSNKLNILKTVKHYKYDYLSHIQTCCKIAYIEETCDYVTTHQFEIVYTVQDLYALTFLLSHYIFTITPSPFSNSNNVKNAFQENKTQKPALSGTQNAFLTSVESGAMRNMFSF